MPEDVKRCVSCDETKSVSLFHRNGKRADGSTRYRGSCAACNRSRANSAYAANPQKFRDRKNRYREQDPERYLAVEREFLKRNPVRHVAVYSITPARYYELLEAQGGGCAICGSSENYNGRRLHVDHDHNCCPPRGSCGSCVRGILCEPCNHGLGRFRDDPELMELAADYVRKNRGKETTNQ